MHDGFMTQVTNNQKALWDSYVQTFGIDPATTTAPIPLVPSRTTTFPQSYPPTPINYPQTPGTGGPYMHGGILYPHGYGGNGDNMQQQPYSPSGFTNAPSINLSPGPGDNQNYAGGRSFGGGGGDGHDHFAHNTTQQYGALNPTVLIADVFKDVSLTSLSPDAVTKFLINVVMLQSQQIIPRSLVRLIGPHLHASLISVVQRDPFTFPPHMHRQIFTGFQLTCNDAILSAILVASMRPISVDDFQAKLLLISSCAVVNGSRYEKQTLSTIDRDVRAFWVYFSEHCGNLATNLPLDRIPPLFKVGQGPKGLANIFFEIIEKNIDPERMIESVFNRDWYGEKLKQVRSLVAFWSILDVQMVALNSHHQTQRGLDLLSTRNNNSTPNPPPRILANPHAQQQHQQQHQQFPARLPVYQQRGSQDVRSQPPASQQKSYQRQPGNKFHLMNQLEIDEVHLQDLYLYAEEINFSGQEDEQIGEGLFNLIRPNPSNPPCRVFQGGHRDPCCQCQCGQRNILPILPEGASGLICSCGDSRGRYIVNG